MVSAKDISAATHLMDKFNPEGKDGLLLKHRVGKLTGCHAAQFRPSFSLIILMEKLLCILCFGFGFFFLQQPDGNFVVVEWLVSDVSADVKL